GRTREEPCAESEQSVQGGPELVRHIREERVFELPRVVELRVQPAYLTVLLLEFFVEGGEIGVLRLEPLRGMPHLHSEAAGVLVGGLALTREGEVGCCELEGIASLVGELLGHGGEEEADQPIA